MAFEETREQQQMYNYFRSCIYIFLIIEIVMNLPVTADNRITQFILDLLGRFKVFNTVSGCKVRSWCASASSVSAPRRRRR